MKAEYVDHMGSDLSIVNAAKVSFNKRSTEVGPKEISLIEFLFSGQTSVDRDRQAQELAEMHDVEEIKEFIKETRLVATHWTPASHTAITLRVKAPVPVRTQCFKHKVGFTENEESRRYIATRPELFIPDHFRSAAANAKQGSGGKHIDSDFWLVKYQDTCQNAIDLYQRMTAHLWVHKHGGATVIQHESPGKDWAISQHGVAPEQARFILPQGVQVNWIWTGNLAAYARYFNQRTDSHAQGESQDLALEIGRLIQPLFPVSWAALTRKV